MAETIRTPEHLDAVGTVEPRRKVAVASLLLGTILEVKVNAGDHVERGQLLVTLDDREILAQLHEAEAAVAAASADLATRERDYERYQQLFKANSVTGSEYDRAKGAYQVAVAQQHRAQEQARRLEVMLSYTRIAASSAGIVADRFADPGDLARARQADPGPARPEGTRPARQRPGGPGPVHPTRDDVGRAHRRGIARRRGGGPRDRPDGRAGVAHRAGQGLAARRQDRRTV